ncbi:hypothetical protein BASA50_003902 [Batrachochytrium salamandrivorans]|uniref:HIT-type domain-containing protein n=1 Tax=Batrachochytrium salamandrivorans TaxID=1357716 RepID=A0ABQ8FHE0_9FUNG|nr:hypothetical protein BASA50_003902 [Batrachochytrium salamandrivorans]
MTTRNTDVICHVCLLQPSKYTCPGCSLRSCSLACVTAHKERSSCNGLRNKTTFIPRQKYDMATLTSDYCFLEDVSRAADTASRDNAPIITTRNHTHSISSNNNNSSSSNSNTPQRSLSYAHQLLLKECYSRGTTLRFMASGMKRHDLNQSVFRKKDQTISWTVEWTFIVDADANEKDNQICILDTRVDETVTIQSALERLMADRPGNALRRHSLRMFCGDNVDISNLVVLLQREDLPVNERSNFHMRIDQSKVLREVLASTTVIEIPRFHVMLERVESTQNSRIQVQLIGLCRAKVESALGCKLSARDKNNNLFASGLFY